jgi:tripartite-type tricarboxylate transporter receptor subunit TctC
MVRQLSQALAKVVEHPEMKQFFARTATDPTPTSPESFEALWRSEQRHWAELIRARQIRAE